MSVESDNNTTSPAVRWGLGAVLLALLGVALLVADGGWLAVTGGCACLATAAALAAKAIRAMRERN
ncbi:hypothetical protein V3C33_01175 [Micrococcaceae bacterium Sec5.7]